MTNSHRLIPVSLAGRAQRWNDGGLPRRQRRLLLGVYLVIATLLRSVDAYRPIDGTVWEAWRETDVGAIARNFYREDSNILHPRIDWRGDGPGLVESEFPLQAWSIAGLYRIFGFHEEIARLLSLVVSVLSCWLFFGIAEMFLPPVGLVAALALFAVNALAVRLSTSIQPEPWMFCFYLAAVRFFLRWLQGSNRIAYVIAAAATALALLVKIPAAHIGVFFSALCLNRWGWRAITRLELWIFAIGSVLPAAIWYWHARGYWLAYGNSLGISNEAYAPIASLNFLQILPRLMVNSVMMEIRWNWTWPGVLIAVAALPSLRGRDGRPLLYWLFSLGLYYVVTIGTTGEGWAYYYRVSSLPIACIVIALAVVNLTRWVAEDGRWATVASVGLCLFVAAALMQLGKTVWRFHPNAWQTTYECAHYFGSIVPKESLIIVSGGEDVDAWGNPNAGDAPFYFYWMDRKGFSLTSSHQNLQTVEAFAERGARFAIVDRARVPRDAGLDVTLQRRYPVRAECGGTILLELSDPSPK